MSTTGSFAVAASLRLIERRWTRAAAEPLTEVAWETRDCRIRGADGAVRFEQHGVEVPADWSQTATNVVASKYFRGRLGEPGREHSVRQLIGRVVETVSGWGSADGVLDGEEAAAFRAELSHLLVHQHASFNSPVWFNVGVEERPQCSACFINSIEDTMGSILDLVKTEGMLFKYGSGAGSNLSAIRSSREALSGGGLASGPVPFMKGFDAFAGVIKSGGKTRRAAKMVILDDRHPDILDFVRSKAIEEKKAQSLIEAGYAASFDEPGGAYDSVAYQNANHSVRLSDAFLRAVEEGGEHITRAVTDSRPMDTMPARELLREIAQAAWACGDPGVQYDDTIQRWHTCPESGRIRASNPCSEFLFLDDTACNLASLNLMRFFGDPPKPDVEGFCHACAVMITAQEILVGRAGYPTPAIADASRRFRPLGLGYANLGALLMASGLPYDSPGGRHLAAAVTAVMTGAAYAQSARLAERLGAFEAFAENREPMLRVVRQHREALDRLEAAELPPLARPIVAAARRCWDEAIELGELHGFRNAQLTVLAPTGTIAFMMDCDTTGIEPDLALVKRKRLVGGGDLSMVNRTVPLALERLGYDAETTGRLVAWVEEHGGLEGASELATDHLPIFDCALATHPEGRSIRYQGHIEMMAAVQPFLSGAISKTVNVPQSASVEEIESILLESWRLGLKAVAVYRDGCKRSQPLSARKKEQPRAVVAGGSRRRLPDERQSITHKFSVGDHEGYLTVGLYEDGKPGEIFLVMAKEGSTISGLMDAFATAISIALQHGVPLETLIGKFSHTRFEPSGFTRNPAIPYAKSVTDYIFRWLASKFLDPDEQRVVGVVQRNGDGVVLAAAAPSASRGSDQQDAPSCRDCGAIMVRNGTCYSCANCGATSGCS